ncbi:MAG: Rieske 2Fe-2S domain-containing protein [Acidimicrobiales bacterium]
MSNDEIDRRTLLGTAWKGGAVLIGAAGAWTAWDLLQPLDTGGFGGVVRAIAADAVPEDSVVAVGAARSYLTKIDGEIVALSQKCPHLGCRVPWCASSGQFECPCHGSVFNRAGDYRAGPAPRGMSRFPTEVGADGLVYIDTGDAEPGPAAGEKETIDEPASGPRCAAEGA